MSNIKDVNQGGILDCILSPRFGFPVGILFLFPRVCTDGRSYGTSDFICALSLLKKKTTHLQLCNKRTMHVSKSVENKHNSFTNSNK